MHYGGTVITPDILLSSLIADLKTLLRPKENWHCPESLSKVFHIRNCVIQLIGPYSESVLWDIAIQSSEAAKVSCHLASPMHHLGVHENRDTSLTEKSLLVSMEDLMTLYIGKLGELIGQGILNRHLSGCLLRMTPAETFTPR